MKKQVLIIITILFTLTLISAAGVDLTINKQEFYQGDLLTAEIEGNFINNLEKINVNIYQDDKVHPSPTASSDLLKKGNKYLYYAVLPHTLGNFSLQIRDSEYWLGQETTNETVSANFTISSTLDPYLSANKGFISATDDFDITIKSLNGIKEVTVTFESQSITKEIPYNGERTFKFNIEGITDYTETSISANDLSIPVFVTPRKSPPDPFINGTETDYLQNQTPNATDETPVVIPLEDATPQQIQTCADINGRICKQGEECSGPTSYARGVICCTGECIEIKESKRGVIVGIILLIILAGGIYYFYKKSKKKAKPKSEKEAMLERAKKFDKRTHPNLETGPEVRKGLTKV